MIHIASGFFVYFHEGHKQYLRSVQNKMKKDDFFIVIVDNEQQQILKYGKIIRDPKDIAGEIRHYLYRSSCVVISQSNDITVNADLEELHDCKFYKDGLEYDKINLPEKDVCEKNNIEIVLLKNKKIASASKILGVRKI